MQYNISCFHFSPPMEDQYGMPDLRHYITSRPLFPPLPQPPDLLRPTHPYDMLIFRSDSTTNAGAASSSGAAGGGCFGGFESGGLNDGGTGRWPRQETLTLLEIRSRLDPKFKEANQKGPLWDEVSRILSEEHGYQRSGKKCREKFENLYKYYKKTKEGKAGRQDGKHYRFFRQLEALYGDNNVINIPASVSENHLLVGCNLHSNFHVKNQEPGIQGGDTSLSLSNYSDEPDDTSVSSEDLSNDTGMKKKKKRGGGRMGWKVKIREFIDTQMKKLMEKQEAWMEKMMRAIENKEQERMMREEEWRKQDALRIEREHKFWANERAWIEARDAALMEALHKLTGKEQAAAEIHSMSGNQNNDDGSDQTMNNSTMWPEGEINRLIQLRSGMEGRFQERGRSEGGELWEEISAKMGCFGHERSGIMCRDKWDSVNNYLLKCNKKRKENSKSCNYNYHHNQGGGGVYNCESQHGGGGIISSLNHDHHRSSSPNNNTTANAMSDSCFRYFMGDTYGRIMD